MPGHLALAQTCLWIYGSREGAREGIAEVDADCDGAGGENIGPRMNTNEHGWAKRSATLDLARYSVSKLFLLILASTLATAAQLTIVNAANGATSVAAGSIASAFPGGATVLDHRQFQGYASRYSLLRLGGASELSDPCADRDRQRHGKRDQFGRNHLDRKHFDRRRRARTVLGQWQRAGCRAAGQLPHTFHKNIFGFGRESIFQQGTPWTQGCGMAPSPEVNVESNIFYFDLSDSAGFYVTGGCADSCGLAYNQFQNFQGNLYWRTDGAFATYNKAFHELTKPPHGNERESLFAARQSRQCLDFPEFSAMANGCSAGEWRAASR